MNALQGERKESEAGRGGEESVASEKFSGESESPRSTATRTWNFTVQYEDTNKGEI